jgi:hypothetical protein
LFIYRCFFWVLRTTNRLLRCRLLRYSSSVSKIQCSCWFLGTWTLFGTVRITVNVGELTWCRAMQPVERSRTEQAGCSKRSRRVQEHFRPKAKRVKVSAPKGETSNTEKRKSWWCWVSCSDADAQTESGSFSRRKSIRPGTRCQAVGSGRSRLNRSLNRSDCDRTEDV